jgi:LysR family transcriptional regulator for metE and metH
MRFVGVTPNGIVTTREPSCSGNAATLDRFILNACCQFSALKIMNDDHTFTWSNEQARSIMQAGERSRSRLKELEVVVDELGSPGTFARLRLEVRHLRLVQAIARERSVTRAARKLNLSQSALSHQLRNLELDLAVSLFHRVGKSMVPTAAGETLLQHADRILTQLSRAETAVRAEHKNGRQVVRLATSCYTHYVWLAAALARFAVRHPRIDVRIEFRETRRELDALAVDQIDVAITTRHTKDAKYESRELFTDDTVAVVAAGHPLALNKPARLRWEHLAHQTLLIHDIPDEDETRLRKAIAVRGGKGPTAIWRVQLTESIVQLAKARQGIGILGRRLAGAYEEDPDCAVIPIGPRGRRSYWAIWRRPNPRAIPVNDLVEIVREAASQPVWPVAVARRSKRA